MKSLSLGKLNLPTNIVYSPLAGLSDYPTRKLIRKYHKGLMFCEMVNLKALLYKIPKTLNILRYSKEMHPIGAQIFGNDPDLVGDAASAIEDMGFDVVDFNCGCPVDRITKRGDGSGMLKTLDLFAKMLYEMVQAVKIPVTVKVRIGWNDKSIVAKELVTIAESMGVKGIFVHGRTREQMYRGGPNLQVIEECAKMPRKIPLMGNGDIFCKKSANHMLSLGCDGILISRGYLGQPWISKDIETENYQKPTTLDILKEHTKYMVEDDCHSSQIKKIITWYRKRDSSLKDLTLKIYRSNNTQEMVEYIYQTKEISASKPNVENIPSFSTSNSNALSF